MPVLDLPEWAVPLWWATDPDHTGVSGNQLIRRWYARMSAPKPPVNACVPELAGWSGVLGRRTWVQAEFRARPAELARGAGLRNREIDEPDNWNTVSRLYSGYVDPLARFSAEFAAVVHDMRPRGLPNDGWVGPLKNRVPPIVRTVMAGATDGPLGGVADSSASADRFIAARAAHRPDYERIARRGYLSVLLDRLEQLRDADSPDDTTMRVLERTIAAHAAKHGDPEQPLRKPTGDEKQRVHELLAAVLEQQPTLTNHRYFTEAYRRAADTLLRWTVQGREDLDAGIIFAALRWARMDALRKQALLDARESLSPDRFPEAAVDALAGVEQRMDIDALFARAHATLAAHAEPGAPTAADSWEKSLALRLLAQGNAVVIDAYDSLADLVRAAWADTLAEGDDRPAQAYAADVETAARYIQILLSMVVSSADRSAGSGTERYARRLDRIRARVTAAREQRMSEPDG